MRLEVIMTDGEIKEIHGATDDLFKMLILMDEVKTIKILGR